MSDLIEALAKYDDANRVAWYFPPWVHELAAAARNWHALTNNRPELMARMARVVAESWGYPEWAELDADSQRAAADLAQSVVDALTDTAEPEE